MAKMIFELISSIVKLIALIIGMTGFLFGDYDKNNTLWFGILALLAIV